MVIFFLSLVDRYISFVPVRRTRQLSIWHCHFLEIKHDYETIGQHSEKIITHCENVEAMCDTILKYRRFHRLNDGSGVKHYTQLIHSPRRRMRPGHSQARYQDQSPGQTGLVVKSDLRLENSTERCATSCLNSSLISNQHGVDKFNSHDISPDTTEDESRPDDSFDSQDQDRYLENSDSAPPHSDTTWDYYRHGNRATQGVSMSRNFSLRFLTYPNLNPYGVNCTHGDSRKPPG